MHPPWEVPMDTQGWPRGSLTCSRSSLNTSVFSALQDKRGQEALVKGVGHTGERHAPHGAQDVLFHQDAEGI